MEAFLLQSWAAFFITMWGKSYHKAGQFILIPGIAAPVSIWGGQKKLIKRRSRWAKKKKKFLLSLKSWMKQNLKSSE